MANFFMLLILYDNMDNQCFVSSNFLIKFNNFKFSNYKELYKYQHTNTHILSSENLLVRVRFYVK